MRLVQIGLDPYEADALVAGILEYVAVHEGAPSFAPVFGQDTVVVQEGHVPLGHQSKGDEAEDLAFPLQDPYLVRMLLVSIPDLLSLVSPPVQTGVEAGAIVEFLAYDVDEAGGDGS
jgi:hypothetical protein